jgi:colicin import membrane protein
MGGLSSLGGVLPALQGTLGVLNTVDRAIGTYGNLTGQGSKDRSREIAAQQQLAADQLHQRQTLEEQLAAKKLSQDQATLSAQDAQDERRRLAALKKSVSRQRAAFGGAGLDVGDTGSTEAVLLGLFDESDAEKRDREQLTGLKQQILDENFNALRNRNLLEASQLSARQQLQSRFA